MGNGDSIFVKDFINQYSKSQFTIDLISLGQDVSLYGVRRQANCKISSGMRILNQIQLYFKLLKSIRKMDDDYDCIVIHYVSFSFALHIHKLQKKSKRIVVVVWGSDFYRVHSKLKIFLQDIIYKKAEKIVFTNRETLKKFNNTKNFIDTRKCFVARFGLPALEEIDILNENPNYNEWCLNFDVPLEKIKIMVGYNADLAHHQLLIIDIISDLKSEESDLFHLIFPLGYGNSNSKYLIENKLKEKNIKNYTVLEKFYGFNEVAKLRLITDILINIQPSDQFSGSMQETLYAGGSVIAGAWLPYKKIVDLGANIFLIESPSEIGEMIIKLVNNYHTKNNHLDKVRESIRLTSSWKENLKVWDDILLNNVTAETDKTY